MRSKRFTATDFQVRIICHLMDNPMVTTYQISRKLKKNFWVVQDALRTLWVKGFIDNTPERKWALMVHEGEAHVTEADYPSGSYSY